MKTQTIGIEIELTGLTRNKAAKTVAKYFGTTANHVGGAYDAYEIEDNSGRIWNIKRDSSIRPQKNVGGEIEEANDLCRVEFISPILTYSDIEPLQELVREIKKAGGLVNTSTGMHIHIGAEGFTATAAHNLINAVASKQELLIKALNVHENRMNYCKRINQNIIDDLNESKPTTMQELSRAWYGDPMQHNYHYHSSRYQIINLHALFTKGTVEFRIFNSTLHAGEVKTAIQFCLALMHQAKTTKKAIYRPTVTDNPKYTMRCWLLRLGLNGEEFKTCRHHLLKNLEGNAAWRQTA